MVERSSPSDLRNNRRTAGSATSRSATSGVQRRHLVPPENVWRQRGQILITKAVFTSRWKAKPSALAGRSWQASAEVPLQLWFRLSLGVWQRPTMRMQLSVDFYFSAAHLLPFYNGPCSRMHGHNYRLQVVLEGAPNPR